MVLNIPVFNEFSTLKTHLLLKFSAGSQGNFWFISSSPPLQLCTTLASEIKLLLFGSGSREKCPCFGTEIHFLWMLSPFSTCFLSVTPLPIFAFLSVAFLSFWSCFFEFLESVSACASAASLEELGTDPTWSLCAFPPVCNEATALWCYQIILFQKLLIKTWLIRQVTKDCVYLFEQYQIATICSSYLVSLFQSHFVGTGFNSARMQEDGDLISCLKKIKITKNVKVS